MLIGENFDKIEFEAFGLDLLEPNAFIGDTLICIVAMRIAYLVRKKHLRTPFFDNWFWFYLVFGSGMFLGGLGHLLFNYTEAYGKMPSWYTGIICVYFVERAMISIHWNDKFKSLVAKIINIKLILALFISTYIFVFVDLSKDPTIGFQPTTINTAIGFIFSFGFLGISYMKKISISFIFMPFSLLFLIPAAIIQAMKINLHQWFDRNDFGHLLIIFSIIFFYLGIKGFDKTLSKVELTD